MVGMFISFEGIDGCGKSTQIRRLAEWLRAAGQEVDLTREPGGSPGAEEIRRLVLTGDTARWSPETELLLFTAARRDHIERRIWPALARGTIVLSDRFTDTTRVYQGKTPARRAIIERLHADLIPISPDVTILLDLDPQVGWERSLARHTMSLMDPKEKEDRFEQMGLQSQVEQRQAFLALSHEFPERIVVISAAGSEDEVSDRILATLRARVPHLFTESA